MSAWIGSDWGWGSPGLGSEAQLYPEQGLSEGFRGDDKDKWAEQTRMSWEEQVMTGNVPSGQDRLTEPLSHSQAWLGGHKVGTTEPLPCETATLAIQGGDIQCPSRSGQNDP